MNFSTFTGLATAPQFLTNGDTNSVLSQAADPSPTNSLYQHPSHNVSDYSEDKTICSTAPTSVVGNNGSNNNGSGSNDNADEARSSDWINLSNASSREEKKDFSAFTVTPSTTNQAVGVLWPTNTMTQNASTMTDLEVPDNSCKSTITKDSDENSLASYGNWDSCSKIHLQRQGNAMAEYLARLQPSTLPLSIQQFLNRHNIKPMPVTGLKKKTNEFKPRNSEVTVTTALDGSTLYYCPECRMAYPERERLEAHMAVHRSERRFECNVCGASLKRKEHLDQHKLRHSEERPFVCEICLKAFKRNEHLRRHFIIHSGNKKHSCPECGKAFSRKDHLNKHTQTHMTKRIKLDNIGESIISHTVD
ncbi:uncharacterized protein LOC142323176 [Lycorma delicatula]|uniref:uncharacterized protein LOC142323176 n=1 Tax=Lycorma delicatula TaxID=130591 RepID=UPI003F5144D4